MSRLHVWKRLSSFSPLSIFFSMGMKQPNNYPESFFFPMTFLSVLNCFGSCLCLRTCSDVYTGSWEGGMTWRFKDYIWKKGGWRGEMACFFPLFLFGQYFQVFYCYNLATNHQSARCRQTISIYFVFFFFIIYLFTSSAFEQMLSFWSHVWTGKCFFLSFTLSVLSTTLIINSSEHISSSQA